MPYFELADQQFDRLRDERALYRDRLTTEPTTGEPPAFDLEADLNFDSLTAFLDFHFPDRKVQNSDISHLLEQLLVSRVSFKEIASALNKIGDRLEEFERDAFMGKDGRWAQTGAVRHILDVTHSKWLKHRDIPGDVMAITNAHKKILKNDAKRTGQSKAK